MQKSSQSEHTKKLVNSESSQRLKLALFIYYGWAHFNVSA